VILEKSAPATPVNLKVVVVIVPRMRSVMWRAEKTLKTALPIVAAMVVLQTKSVMPAVAKLPKIAPPIVTAAMAIVKQPAKMQ